MSLIKFKGHWINPQDVKHITDVKPFKGKESFMIRLSGEINDFVAFNFDTKEEALDEQENVATIINKHNSSGTRNKHHFKSYNYN